MVKNIKMQTQYGESIVIIAILSMNRIKDIVQERSRYFEVETSTSLLSKTVIQTILEYFICLLLKYFACLVRGPPSAGVCLVRSASCRLAAAGPACKPHKKPGARPARCEGEMIRVVKQRRALPCDESDTSE